MRHPLQGLARVGAALLCMAGARGLPAAPLCVDPDQDSAVIQRMAEADLKTLYLACTRESSERRLSTEEAAHCSNAADVLKIRAFGGDFNAMIGWLHEARGATRPR